MTVEEFSLLVKAHRRRDIEEWRRARWLAAIIVNVNRDRRRGPISPEKLLKLPDDEREITNVMSRERLNELKEKWKDIRAPAIRSRNRR